MGIINRTQDTSEQKESLRRGTGAQITATEFIIATIERACTITDAKAACIGISGAPTGMLRVNRFASTGGSTFNIGSTLAVPAFGLSSYGTFSLPATGHTTLNLQKNDVLSVICAGGSAAASTDMIVDVIVQNLQDIKTWY